MPRRKRLIDRIADAIVLLPAALGAFCLIDDLVSRPGMRSSGGAEVFLALAFVSGALHVWFRAEDRWRAARAARRRTLRQR